MNTSNFKEICFKHFEKNLKSCKDIKEWFAHLINSLDLSTTDREMTEVYLHFRKDIIKYLLEGPSTRISNEFLTLLYICYSPEISDYEEINSQISNILESLRKLNIQRESLRNIEDQIIFEIAQKVRKLYTEQILFR